MNFMLNILNIWVILNSLGDYNKQMLCLIRIINNKWFFGYILRTEFMCYCLRLFVVSYLEYKNIQISHQSIKQYVWYKFGTIFGSLIWVGSGKKPQNVNKLMASHYKVTRWTLDILCKQLHCNQRSHVQTTLWQQNSLWRLGLEKEGEEGV